MAVLVHEITKKYPDFSETTLAIKQTKAHEFTVVQYDPPGVSEWPTVYGRYPDLAQAMRRFEEIRATL